MEYIEKALELINKFEDFVDYEGDDCFTEREKMFINAKNCALITVEEVIKVFYFINPNCDDLILLEELKYWKDVKTEIEQFETNENILRNDDEVLKFTKNTPEVRKFLEGKGFKGLSFFQGGEFIYAVISIRANKNGEWKEKNYSTFNEKDKQRMTFLNKEISKLEEFKTYIDKI